MKQGNPKTPQMISIEVTSECYQNEAEYYQTFRNKKVNKESKR